MVMLSLASCGSIGGETVTSAAGEVYDVKHFRSINASDLPANSDLKMADGNLPKFAVEECGLVGPAGTGPEVCDLYVQPDPKGSLIGFATVTVTKGRARFSAVAKTDSSHKPANSNCFIEGGLLQTGENYSKPVSLIENGFKAQIQYSAWQKSPDNWLVSDAEQPEDVNPEASLGVWYVTATGDKLRLEQERWNYCYSDPSVFVDDVFYRVVRLVRRKAA